MAYFVIGEDDVDAWIDDNDFDLDYQDWLRDHMPLIVSEATDLINEYDARYASTADLINPCISDAVEHVKELWD